MSTPKKPESAPVGEAPVLRRMLNGANRVHARGKKIVKQRVNYLGQNMARTRASIRILPQEYDFFVKVIPNDEHLPNAYDAWIKRSSQDDAHCIANGEVIKEVIVQYEAFAKYRRSTGQQSKYFVLMAFAVSKAMTKPQP